MSNVVSAMASGTFTGMLRSLADVLDKGAEHARSAGRDPDALLQQRLADDMFPLVRQVQIACDHAVAATARLQGGEPPRVADEETTLEALKARIARTIDYVERAPAAGFEGAQSRRIAVPLMEDMVLDVDGVGYLRDWALPHFYFHVVTAYDILRHDGAAIGKRDYLAHIGPSIRQKSPPP